MAATMHKPDLIIIDEPFSGLDPVNTRLIKELIYRMRDQGAAIIMSTHQMHQVEEWLAIVNSPNSSLAVSLSLIPFSAPVAMLLRMTSTTVPGWQLGLGLALLALAAGGIIWLMAPLFRTQTLLSGEALSLRRLWLVLRAGS